MPRSGLGLHSFDPKTLDGRQGYITVHPSYLLRMPNRDAKETAYRDFVRDLRSIRKLAGTST